MQRPPKKGERQFTGTGCERKQFDGGSNDIQPSHCYNVCIDAPRHDWKLVEKLSAESDAAWVRGLSYEERFAIYADFFNTIWLSRSKTADWERLEQWHWEQKLELRKRMVKAYQALDRLQNERAAAEQ